MGDGRQITDNERPDREFWREVAAASSGTERLITHLQNCGFPLANLILTLGALLWLNREVGGKTDETELVFRLGVSALAVGFSMVSLGVWLVWNATKSDTIQDEASHSPPE